MGAPDVAERRGGRGSKGFANLLGCSARVKEGSGTPCLFGLATGSVSLGALGLGGVGGSAEGAYVSVSGGVRENMEKWFDSRDGDREGSRVIISRFMVIKGTP